MYEEWVLYLGSWWRFNGFVAKIGRQGARVSITHPVTGLTHTVCAGEVRVIPPRGVL